MIHAVAAKVALGALAAGGLTVGGVSATEHCSPGQVLTSFGCGTVTATAPDTVRGGTGITSATTVNVDFRDSRGNRTTSGISTQDQFEWLGGKKQGKDGDGTLIEVQQTTEHKGGWGPLYKGWIPMKYTQAPVMFKNLPSGPEPAAAPSVETEQGG